MVDSDTRKKYAVLSVSSVILVAMVVAVTIGTQRGSTEHHEDMASSQKAVQGICAPTDYKDACVKSLKNSNSTDPKELVVEAFKATINHIREAAENSTVLHEVESDPRTKLALENCQELAQRAIQDMEKSNTKFQEFDLQNIDEILSDIQIWLSGAITYQETCLDGFENTTGDAAEKMKKALNTSMELTSNGLAMINDVSSILTTTDSPAAAGRRLLATDVISHGDELPNWVDSRKRYLLQASPKSIRADLVVAKDGTGKFKTINEALKVIPEKRNRTFVLYIKEGLYEEKVEIPNNQAHLVVIGDGPTKTRISGKLNFIDGTPTYHTATVAVLGDFFISKDIGFENSAGPEKHQAVALRVASDKSIFYNCHMDGYQDTLYAHTYRQFYRNCRITGTIDFIFGDGAAVFQNCTLVVRKPMDNQQCIVTAQGRKDIRQPTGLTLQNCSFVADPEYYPLRNRLKSYLGRPWKEYSRTIIVESFIDNLIQPEGWLPWTGDFGLKTLFYAEFNNRGPGSGKSQRVKWPGVKELQSNRVERFFAGKFIEGDTWIPPTGLPYRSGFIFPPPKEDPNIKYSPVEPEETKDIGKPMGKEDYKMSSPPPPGSRPDNVSDSGSTPEIKSGSGSGSGSENGSNPVSSPKPSPKPDFQSEADLQFSFGNDYNYDSQNMSPEGSPQPSFPGAGSPEVSLADVVVAPEPSSVGAGSPEPSLADVGGAHEPSLPGAGSPEQSLADVVEPEQSPSTESGSPRLADDPSMPPASDNPGLESAANAPSSAPAPSDSQLAPAADGQTMASAADGSTMAPAADDQTMAPAAEDQTMAPAAEGQTMAPAADGQTMAPAAVVPAADGSTIAPTADDQTMAVAADASIIAPAADKTMAQAADVPTMAPSSDSSKTTPEADSPTMAPAADDSKTEPAADGSTVAPAADDSKIAPEADGTTMAPEADGTTIAPAADDSKMAPAADGSTMAPAADDSKMAPAADDQTMAPAPSGPGSIPAADEPTMTQTPSSLGLAPAADDLAQPSV